MRIQKGKHPAVKTVGCFSVIHSIGDQFVPDDNSLNKTSALKVNAALRKFVSAPGLGRVPKTPRNASKLFRELYSGIVRIGG